MTRPGPNTHPLLLALADIKLAHSVFAMPFALLGAMLVTHRWGVTEARGPYQWLTTGREYRWSELGGQLALVVVCMFFARTWAMLVNRLADARFDAENQRTARRAIASGKLSPRHGLVVALGAGVLFLTACGGFWIFFANPLPLALGAPVLAWIAFYSFTKRFTWLCHAFLGGALAVSPIAAAIAVNPDCFFGLAEYFSLAGESLGTDDQSRSAILLLAAFVLLWVAGFDVAYALQDIDFDRRTGLYSIPARLGVRGSLWVSRLMHAAALVALILAARAEPRFGSIFDAAVIAVALLLLIEHAVLIRRGVAGLPLAFFTINGVVSLTLGAAGISDLFI